MCQSLEPFARTVRNEREVVSVNADEAVNVETFVQQTF